MSGESEAKLRSLFADALAAAPSLIFIDEIDSITGKRENAQRDMERRIVAQLLTCMDSLSTQYSSDKSKIVIVIGATNRPDSLDTALRRAGRFDREISIPMPDDSARAKILQVMCSGMRLEGGETFDFLSIAKAAVGFVGADLAALTREAAIIAVNRIFRYVLPTPTLTAIRPSGNQQNFENLALPKPSTSTSTSSSNTVFNVANSSANSNPASATSLLSNLHLQTANSANNSSIQLPSPTENSVAGSNNTAQPMLLTDYLHPKDAADAAELNARSTASHKLRAHISPLSEAQLAGLSISMADFEVAVKVVQPSAKREGFATIPDVSWNDIGALDELRDELNMSIFQPIRNPEQYRAIGLTVPAGVLLFGPPGCGKTLVAKAIANESGASFLSIKGPELLNQYVGQSERAVRRVFERAASSKPCIIFFDELDALVPRRSNNGADSGGSQVSERVVNQLLTAMDGLNERTGIFVIAATNRPDIIDPAMLRPGRLDKLLYVALPNQSERAAILAKHMRLTPLQCLKNCSEETERKKRRDEFIEKIAVLPHLNGFSGADCAALVREATILALKQAQEEYSKSLVSQAGLSAAPATNLLAQSMSKKPSAPLQVGVEFVHFEQACKKVFPSVSEAARKRYEKMKKTLCTSRAILTEEPANNNSLNNNQTNAAAEEKHQVMDV
jgi:ribosome biogenesis ATPase